MRDDLIEKRPDGAKYLGDVNDDDRLGMHFQLGRSDNFKKFVKCAQPPGRITNASARVSMRDLRCWRIRVMTSSSADLSGGSTPRRNAGRMPMIGAPRFARARHFAHQANSPAAENEPVAALADMAAEFASRFRINEVIAR